MYENIARWGVKCWMKQEEEEEEEEEEEDYIAQQLRGIPHSEAHLHQRQQLQTDEMEGAGGGVGMEGR